jgi:hypothetical protein
MGHLFDALLTLRCDEHETASHSSPRVLSNVLSPCEDDLKSRNDLQDNLRHDVGDGGLLLLCLA